MKPLILLTLILSSACGQLPKEVTNCVHMMQENRKLQGMPDYQTDNIQLYWIGETHGIRYKFNQGIERCDLEIKTISR